MKNAMTKILLPAIIIILAAGCDSYATKKQAAYTRWEKTSARAKIAAAIDLFENGRIEEAEKTALQCIEADPEIAQAHLLTGRIYSFQGKLEQATQALKKAIEIDKNLDQAWYVLGTVAQQQRQPADAMEYFGNAMAIKPAKTDYIIAVAETSALQGDYDRAIGLLEEKIDHLPGDTALKIETADLLSRMGRTKDAIKMYIQTILLGNNDPALTEALGYCYITDQQWNNAIKTFEKLYKTASKDQKPAYLEIMAMCSMNDGQYSRAFSYFDKLSVDQRDSAELWLQMGQAALGADSSPRAAACARRALALRPGWSDAIAVQGCSLYLSQDYTAAIKIFRKITADKKLAGFAWLMTGRCYQQLGQTGSADKAYEKAVNLNSESKLVTLLTRPYQQVK